MLISCVPQHFYGRQTEVDFILQGISAEEPRSFVINGPRKMGKSVLLHFLRHADGATRKLGSSLAKFQPGMSDSPLFFFYFDAYKLLADPILAALPGLLTRSRDFVERMGEDAVKIPTGKADPAALWEWTLNLFQQAAHRNIRLVLIFDHFDEAYRAMDYATEIHFRTLASHHALLFVTTQNLSGLKSVELKNSPLLSILKEWTLKLLGQQDGADLINRPAREALLPFSKSDAAFILDTAGTHPYLLTLVSEYLFSLHAENNAMESIIPVDKAIQKQISAQLLGLPAIQSFFELIMGQLSPGERAVLNQLLWSDAADIIDQQALVSLTTLHQLASLDLQNGRYRLFSELFADYLRLELDMSNLLRNIANQLSGYDGKLLLYLLDHPNQLCTFEQLGTDIWDNQDAKRAVEGSIHRLRKILEKDIGNSDMIQNVRGKGYKYLRTR